MLQELVRYVFDNSRPFAAWHYLGWGEELRPRVSSGYSRFVFVRDPFLPPIETPNSSLEFLVPVPVTETEYLMVQKIHGHAVVDVLKDANQFVPIEMLKKGGR